MKKILVSLMLIALVFSAVAAGTFAYFSDIETIEGNVFAAGTIDIELTADAGATVVPILIEDMKPCDWAEYTFNVENVGTNDGPIYLHFEVIESWNAIQSEPGDPNTNDIENWIDIDLKKGEYVVISPEDGVTLADLHCSWIELGWLGVDETLPITLSFHLKAETGNAYQGDAVNFNVEVMMTDHNAPGPVNGNVVLFLENKDAQYWFITEDDMWGKLTFSPVSATFDYDLYAQGLEADTDYNLIYYADPWDNQNGALIGTHTSDAVGVIDVTGQSVDLGISIPVPADANYPAGGKIWLIPAADGSVPMTGWNPLTYLFETILIKYQDTDS